MIFDDFTATKRQTPAATTEQRQALHGVLHRGPVQQIAEGLEGIVDEGHGRGTEMFLETTGTSAGLSENSHFIIGIIGIMISKTNNNGLYWEYNLDNN